MAVVTAVLWFCTPVLLALAYLWASRRLPLPLWAGVLGPLTIIAILVIAVPALEVGVGKHRGRDLEAMLVAGLLLQAPVLVCWLAWRSLRVWRWSDSRHRTTLARPDEGREVARLRHMVALRERARRAAGPASPNCQPRA